MDLNEELQRVDEELRGARAEHARLGARLRGLTAERDALVGAIENHRASDIGGPPRDLKELRKDRAIVAILRDATTPMRIAEIVEGLARAGRTNETYNGVSVYLDWMVKQGHVRRVARGLYAAP
jgi:hypothetical protein